MIEEGLFKVLEGDATVNGLVGARIFPLLMPQASALPAIVYQNVASVHIASLGGPSGLQSTRMQIDCYAASYAAVKTLQKAVRKALDGFSGVMTDADATNVNSCLLSSSLELFEDVPKVYRVTMDFELWFNN